jgi:hypothetical protein
LFMHSTGVSVIAALAFAVPANADRLGNGPVGNPHVVDTYHVAFLLPGDTWAQVAGAMAWTPSLGQYTFAAGATPPVSITGNITVNVGAGIAKLRPTRRGNGVVVNPGSKDPRRMKVESGGTNGPVRWWTGRVNGNEPYAVGYQRAPRSLDASGKRWLLYGVSTDLSFPAITARTPGAAAMVRTIARTMRLAVGPVLSSGPYAGA